ncbi:MAG: signal peptidase II [Vicinamibacteria bacterium]
MGDANVKRRRRWMVALLLLLLTVACDQATKHVAASSFTDVIPYSLVGGFVELLYSENPGAFLGLGSDFHHSTRFWLFTVGVGGLLLLFAARLLRATRPVELVGWSLVIGGGLSNLIDRLMRDGRVVDFLRVGIGDMRTGIFNIADAAIVLGLLCLFASALWLHGDRLFLD